MRGTSFAIDIGSIFPIILLLLFIVLPALLKRLGQYTAAGKNADRPQEQDRDVTIEERMREYLEGPPGKQDFQRPGKESFSNKPIHPKWF